ncbi:unnamed protein product, partial [Mesorhabditis spiculigera]
MKLHPHESPALLILFASMFATSFGVEKFVRCPVNGQFDWPNDAACTTLHTEPDTDSRAYFFYEDIGETRVYYACEDGQTFCTAQANYLNQDWPAGCYADTDVKNPTNCTCVLPATRPYETFSVAFYEMFTQPDGTLIKIVYSCAKPGYSFCKQWWDWNSSPRHFAVTLGCYKDVWRRWFATKQECTCENYNGTEESRGIGHYAGPALTKISDELTRGYPGIMDPNTDAGEPGRFDLFLVLLVGHACLGGLLVLVAAAAARLYQMNKPAAPHRQSVTRRDSSTSNVSASRSRSSASNSEERKRPAARSLKRPRQH